MDAKGVEGLEHERGEKARKGWIVWSTKGAKRAKGAKGLEGGRFGARETRKWRRARKGLVCGRVGSREAGLGEGGKGLHPGQLWLAGGAGRVRRAGSSLPDMPAWAWRPGWLVGLDEWDAPAAACLTCLPAPGVMAVADRDRAVRGEGVEGGVR
jgi:hypothetical protein